MAASVKSPLVSIVVCTKNGMPHVREAMASLEGQTYRNFEVVVQDAASRDGTAEYLRRLSFARQEVVSEPDAGIGDAFARALARCAGEIVGSLDADNLLEPDGLHRVVDMFREHPRAAAIYGAVQLIDEGGAPVQLFTPSAFEPGAVMRCELVPPFSAAFFSRRACGAELMFDASLPTCADYDLWLRISHLEIVSNDAVLGRTRLGQQSMTRDASRYEAFCRDKLAALDRHLERRPTDEDVRAEAMAGIYCWAAESILELDGPGHRFESYVERAAVLRPASVRLQRVRERARAMLGASHERGRSAAAPTG